MGGVTRHEPDNPEKIKVVVDDGYDPNNSSLDALARFKGDKFKKSGDAIRGLKGLSPNMKRKITRKKNKLEKFHRGGDEETAGSKQIHEEGVSGYAMFDVATPPYNLDYLAKLYEISSAHKSAVDAKVSNIVGLGYHWDVSLKLRHQIERMEEDENTDKSDLKNKRRNIERAESRLNDWIEHLNRDDTFEEILRKVWTDVETMGNGYLELGRTISGGIGYVGHIPANTMRMRTKRDGYVQIVANKVVYFRNYGDLETPNPIGDDPRPNEVIHFKKYSSGQTYYGVPDIIAAKNAVAGNEFAARFNLEYFEHKAVPRYVITLKGAELSEEAERKIVGFFSTAMKGKHHRTLYIPLPGESTGGEKVEFKMEAVEASIQDASFDKYYKMNREEILMSHRVPQTKVGLTQDVNLAVARDSDKMFKEQVTRPAQRIIEQKFSHIFEEVTDAFDFKLNELTLTDEETKARIHQIYSRWDILENDEIREELGYAPKEEDEEEPALDEQNAEQRAQAQHSRTRDQEREGGPDERGEARNAAGEGRSTP